MTGPYGHDALTPRRRQAILLVCSLSVFMIYIDNTVLNVALPAMQSDLRTGVSGAHRIVQALGGALVSPSSLSTVRHVFTESGERARAMGVWGAVFGVAIAAGPLVGGLLVDTCGWRAVFWVNVPIGMVAVSLGRRFVPESRAPRPRRPDASGQALMVAFLVPLTYAVIQGPTRGWAGPDIRGGFVVAALALIAFIGVELLHREPMLELRHFLNREFSGAIVVAALTFVTLSGFMFVNTFYLQQARGLSAFDAGLATLPLTAMIAVAAPVAGRWVGRRGPRTPMIISGVCVAAGALILLSTISPTVPYPELALAYLLLGAGLGVVNPPMTATALSSMPTDQAGAAAGTAGTARQIGNVVGVAVMGAMVNTTAHTAHPSAQVLTSATRAPWLLAVALGLAIAATAFWTAPAPSPV